MKLVNLAAATLMLFNVNAFAHDEPLPGTIAISRATELAVHRIERLVILKKIDAVFLTALVGLRAETSSENGATYKVSGYVAPGADGKSLSITLWQDIQGKTLAFNVAQASLPVSPFTWPTKDSVTLMEEGLHFVLEGWVQYPEVKAFYTGLQTIDLAPVQDAQGNLLAQFKVTSHEDARTLTILLKSDGSFVSHEIK